MLEVVVAVVIAFAVSISLGASVALASRNLLTAGPLWRSPSLWSLVALHGLVFLPVSCLLLQKFADWCVLYLFDMTQVGQPAVLAVFFPLATIGTFFAARRLLLRGKTIPTTAIAIGGLLIAAAVAWLARKPLLIVGTLDTYRSGAGIRPLTETALVYLLAGGGLVIVVGWVATLWRLSVVNNASLRANTPRHKAAAPSSHPQHTQPPRRR